MHFLRAGFSIGKIRYVSQMADWPFCKKLQKNGQGWPNKKGHQMDHIWWLWKHFDKTRLPLKKIAKLEQWLNNYGKIVKNSKKNG